MRRRARGDVGSFGHLTSVPLFVDDLSLPAEARVREFDRWVATYWEPWIAERDAYETANNVNLVSAEDRHIYAGRPGVVFVENMPTMPDGPFDRSQI